MKKSIFIAVLGVASSIACYGQGVFFSNYSSSTQSTGTIFGGGPLAGLGVGSDFTATLYFGPAGSTLSSQLAPIGNSLTYVTSLGYPTLHGGAALGGGSAAGSFGVSTINLPAYNTAYALAIFATGTYQGVTYSGFSPIVAFTSQASAGVPIPDLPASLHDSTFSVVSVPEPTTLALAGLGLASLVAFRRKQS